MPLVLDAAQWTPLEVGLAQRAELLNALLQDLYGEQRLLAEGVLPAAAVLGHAGFVRPVARRSATDPRPLVLCGVDLGRDAAGEWRVLGDRAQAPSGLGHAMENRRAVSRVVPELYREAGPHRVEPYLWALRSALLQSADDDLADPRVVVLSPGTCSGSAYDQAFLASALGFPLVRGSDLVVRDGWVHLRASGRLERVDVVLRRVDAAWSDPLELRGDSRLGVAGLTEAVRRGRVRVVNGLGAGVLENPALLPHLPAACQALLGEPLRLASVPTWWCGDPDSLEHVLDRVGELGCAPSTGRPRRSARGRPGCAGGSSPSRTGTWARSGCRSRTPRRTGPAPGPAPSARPRRGRSPCGRSCSATARPTARSSGASRPSTTSTRSPAAGTAAGAAGRARTCGCSRGRPRSRTRGSPRCCR
ncbi:circularly permuted type 2 ATP-grasp protein [Nocardioides sp. Arc9.136]|uniref:circularly permuted type 2 ATP-grasp protein n=1 Tax=Nocardioides sp. Arc9.136 TaxID=2996826 RepID=UPI00349E5684